MDRMKYQLFLEEKKHTDTSFAPSHIPFLLCPWQADCSFIHSTFIYWTFAVCLGLFYTKSFLSQTLYSSRRYRQKVRNQINLYINANEGRGCRRQGAWFRLGGQGSSLWESGNLAEPWGIKRSTGLEEGHPARGKSIYKGCGPCVSSVCSGSRKRPGSLEQDEAGPVVGA